MKALSLEVLAGVTADGKEAAAEGRSRAGAAHRGSLRFGEALGQALAKHAGRAEGEGEATGGTSKGVEAGVAAAVDAEGRPAHPRRGLSTTPALDAAAELEATAAEEGAAGGERTRRAPARKRPATEERPATPEGAPGAGHAAASAAPPRAPTVDPTARLAARAAAKGPLAAPSSAKPQAPSSVREKAREREATKAEVAVPTAAAREALTPPAAATEARPASRAAASQPAAPLPAPGAGQELQGGVLRSAAHLKLDAGSAGTLELHLRVRDGALHLRVEGEGARALEARSGELSQALAGEGLKLAPIELGGTDAGLRAGGEGGRGFEERREAWQEAAEAQHHPGANPARATRSDAGPQAGRGIHVEA